MKHPSRHGSSTHPRFLLLFLVLLFTLCAILVQPVGFAESPVINYGTTVYVTDALICRFGITNDTSAISVAWYNGSTLYSSTYDNTTLNTTSTLPSYTALKHQAWTCLVTLFNATANTTQGANITIQSSAPTTPILINASGQDIGIVTNVTKDQTYTYTLNSSDADPGDTLTYYLLQTSFCTVTNSATGTVSCTPTHADVSLPNQNEVVTQKNITFWVEDNDPIFAKSSSVTVTFNITPVTTPPTLTIPTQTTLVNATYNQTFIAADEQDYYPLTAALVPSLTDPQISPNVDVTEEGNSTVRIVYFTSPIQWSDVGNRTVTLNLTDSRNASRLITFTLQIISVNRPPYWTNITPTNFNSSLPNTYILSQGQDLFINLSANDPDTAGNTQVLVFSSNSAMSQFSVTTTSATATNTSDATGYINFIPTKDDVGNHSVAITVTDQSGATNSTTLNFTVFNVNDPPVIKNQSFGADQHVG